MPKPEPEGVCQVPSFRKNVVVVPVGAGILYPFQARTSLRYKLFHLKPDAPKSLVKSPVPLQAAVAKTTPLVELAKPTVEPVEVTAGVPLNVPILAPLKVELIVVVAPKAVTDCKSCDPPPPPVMVVTSVGASTGSL